MTEPPAQTPTSGSHLPAWVLPAFFTAIALYALVVVLGFSSRALVSRVFDDTFYFLKIAQNATSGGRASFDGIHSTNGFQPLWLLVLLPLYGFLHFTPETMLRLVLLLQVVMLGAAAWIMMRFLREFFPLRIALTALILVVFAVLYPALNGMESAVLILTMVSLLAYGAHASVFDRFRPRTSLVFGALLGLVFLSRLDTVFLAPALGAVGLLTGQESLRVKVLRLCCIAGATTIVVIPYLIWNLLTTGHVMPISEQLKSTFPVVSFEVSRIARFGVRYLACLAFGALYLFWLPWRARGPSRREPGWGYVDGAIAVGAAGMLMHALHSVLFMRWAVFRWHHIWYALIAALIITRVLASLDARLPEPRRTRVGAIIAILALLGGVAETARQDFLIRRGAWHVGAYNAAVWARSQTDPADVFAMHDAGTFGYFSERRVINLDGVVNDLAYQEVLREGRLHDYLDENHVKFIVSHELGKQEDRDTYVRTDLLIRSRRYPASADSILVWHRDEIYRGPVYRHERRHHVVCVIWRFRS